MSKNTKNEARKIRHYRIRNKIVGTELRPRINVYKSNKAFYVQVIDDNKGNTLTSSSTLQLKLPKNNINNAKLVGEDLLKKMKKLKIKEAVFDRGGYIYHGKIRAFVEILREGGINI